MSADYRSTVSAAGEPICRRGDQKRLTCITHDSLFPSLSVICMEMQTQALESRRAAESRPSVTERPDDMLFWISQQMFNRGVADVSNRDKIADIIEEAGRRWAASPAGPEAVPQSELPQPRDTPHLDRDGDRWRGRSSEARLAVTDDGPRSESRSSGGWQGGPSGDIQRAIAIIEDSRQTHVNWADWRRKGNGTDTDHEMIGDLEWHENAIRDYDHVLAVLRSVAVPQSEPPEPLGIDHPVEVLAQAYMDLCSRVDEPFSVTLIDEARQSVGAVPQREREGLLRLALEEISEGTEPDRIGKYEYLRDWVHKTARAALASPAHPDEECSNCGGVGSHTEYCVHHPDVQARLRS